MYRHSILCIGSAIFCISLACTSTKKTSRASNEAYQEDLSVHRIKYETEEIPVAEETSIDVERPFAGQDVKPVNDITPRINNLLDSLANESGIHNVQGFTIQVYSGNSREQASDAKSLVYKLVPNSRPETIYVQPNYKVKVGKFLSRFEAQSMYSKLESEFPNVLVVPERFALN